jgi:hexosaminidase
VACFHNAQLPDSTNMVKTFEVFIFLFFSMTLSCFSQHETNYPVIPQPISLKVNNEAFTISSGTSIVTNDHSLKEVGNIIAVELGNITGKRISSFSGRKSHSIFITLDTKILNEEEYHISVSNKKIDIRVSAAKGAFYALQTLKQLILFSPLNSGKVKNKVPGCEIIDYPNYTYRGFHIDVARHFFSKAYIIKLIDWLSYYKFNKLQLHLTDDQGWRVEIEQFPLLTNVGAWRSFNKLDSICMQKSATDPGFELDKRFIKEVNGKQVYGGFYTKQDIREIIAYASARFIDVIPEIDMPGHMSAAIEAYPFLSCTGSIGWGKEFSYPICPCKPEVMDFCFKVWDEIADLFPYNVVHIGSDEVEKDTWATSAVCQQFMKENNLTNLNGIQNYYVNHIQKHLETKGKKVIAWDDVIDGNIDSNLIMMYWRDWLSDSPVKCAGNGNNIILTPWTPFYLSGRHTDKTFAELYNYAPADSLSAEVVSKVIGLQGCVWTEEIPSEAKFEYHVFPRLQALAEVCWSSQRDWESFKTRLLPHEHQMDSSDIHYRIPGWEK